MRSDNVNAKDSKIILFRFKKSTSEMHMVIFGMLVCLQFRHVEVSRLHNFHSFPSMGGQSVSTQTLSAGNLSHTALGMTARSRAAIIYLMDIVNPCLIFRCSWLHECVRQNIEIVRSSQQKKSSLHNELFFCLVFYLFSGKIKFRMMPTTAARLSP